MAKNRVRITDVPRSHLDLTGTTIVFTGGTNGMGQSAVVKLARMGATIHLLGRDATKLREVADAANQATGTHAIRTHDVDFSSQSSIRDAASTLLATRTRVDVLINCVGSNFPERHITSDGVERSWAVNHLGSFLFTHLLLDRLKDSAPARIVQVSSATERGGRIHADVTLGSNWTGMRAYSQAKLAVNMTTREFARRLAGTGVTINALHPGWINTELSRGKSMALSGPVRALLEGSTAAFAKPVYAGGNNIVTLAVAPQYDGVSGEYVFEDHIRQPNKIALDDAEVQRVWDMSCDQVGILR